MIGEVEEDTARSDEIAAGYSLASEENILGFQISAQVRFGTILGVMYQ